MRKLIFALLLCPVWAYGQPTTKYILDSNDVVQPSFMTASNAAVLSSGITNISPTNVSFNTYMSTFVRSTNAGDARTNLGLIWAGLTNSNASTMLSALGGLATNGSAENLTNFPTLNQNTTGTASNVTGVVAVINGGSGATNQAGARTNLGLGASWLTNANAPVTTNASLLTTGTLSNNRLSPDVLRVSGGKVYGGSSPGTLWWTNDHMAPKFIALSADEQFATEYQDDEIFSDHGVTISFFDKSVSISNTEVFKGSTNDIMLGVPLAFTNESVKSTTRTNLGIPWVGLTNTNASSFRSVLELSSTNNVQFGSVGGYGEVAIRGYLSFYGTSEGQKASSIATTRTNLGIPWSGLTNTNAADFLTALGISHTTNSPAWTNAPAATNSVGIPGQIAYASNYFYICVGTNVWRRAQLGTW